MCVFGGRGFARRRIASCGDCSTVCSTELQHRVQQPVAVAGPRRALRIGFAGFGRDVGELRQRGRRVDELQRGVVLQRRASDVRAASNDAA